MAGSNFVDYVKIFARSGHGGAGSAHFRREKFVAFGGPDGGDGGKGGSIVLQGDSQYWTLIHLKYQRHQFAEDGQCGSGARSSGRDARDIVIPVPLGTVARRVVEQEDGTTLTEDVGEVTADGEQLVLLKGGRGGLGNWHFKSATNQTPRYAQPGEEGDEGTFILELKVLADVGLVGFPNAGKSTLLSVVSAAKPKIANYAFTTLEPNLGIVEVRDHKSFVMADIPGIIEGASEGRGLGHQFLRHIERTALIMHVVDMTGGFEDRDPVEDYRIINRELEQYGAELSERPQIVVANKCDAPGTADKIADLKRAALDDGHMFFAVSAVTGAGLNTLMLAVGEQVAKLRAELAVSDEPVDLRDEEWERRRLQREKRFRIVQEEPGAFRVVGRAIERLVIQTDWENEEAVIYLQHKFSRMGVDDALQKAGCRAGDEVRICQRAFDFEGAEDFSEFEDELEDGSEDVAVEVVDVADDSLEAADAVDAIDGIDDAFAAEDVETPEGE